MNWNDPDWLVKVAKITPYAFIILGGLVAVSGQFVRDRIELRVSALRDTAKQERMNTPPQFKLSAGLGSGTGEKPIELQFLNDIPFRASWYVLTRGTSTPRAYLWEKSKSSRAKAIGVSYPAWTSMTKPWWTTT